MEQKESQYVKRTQKDYSMSFKLSVVREYETTNISYAALDKKYGIQGKHTIAEWVRKYGNFDYENKTDKEMPKTKEHELMELREKIKYLERKNARLEQELEQKDHKVAIFDMMIDIAEEEYKIDIRKNSSAEQSKNKKK